MKVYDINIEEYDNIHRDDLLNGGTKSVVLPYVLDSNYSEFVYATPVYGAFQIALTLYANSIGKKATLFCAERKIKHDNTMEVINNGGNVIEVKHGYLSVVQKRARDYAMENNAQLLPFGAYDSVAKDILIKRAISLTGCLDFDVVFCALGSGTLYESICEALPDKHVIGVSVGKDYINNKTNGTVLKYELPFEKKSKIKPPFKCSINYDAKAWHYCKRYKQQNEDKKILFWNVY